MDFKHEVTMSAEQLAVIEQNLRLEELRLRIKELKRYESFDDKFTKERQDKFNEQGFKVKELELKVKELETPAYKKISTYSGILAIVIALGSVVAQNYWSGIKADIAKRDLEDLKNEHEVISQNKNAAESDVKKAKILLRAVADSIVILTARTGVLKQQVKTSDKSLEEIAVVISNSSDKNSAIRKISNIVTKTQSTLSENSQLIERSRTKSESAYLKSPPLNARKDLVPDQNGLTIQQTSRSSHNYPDDPQKEKWGKLSERNGRKITASVRPIRFSRYFSVTITVVSIDKLKPLTGEIHFHLHNTFADPDPVVKAENNQAVLVLTSYGAFTLGAEMDNGATTLELDLADLANLPAKFLEN